MKRAFLHFACAFLLLSAQLTALTHSVWHLHDHLPAHTQHDGAGATHEGGGEPSHQAGLCVFHAAFSSLSTGGCGAPLAVVPADQADWLASAIVDPRFARATLTPPSRAPPVLL